MAKLLITIMPTPKIKVQGCVKDGRLEIYDRKGLAKQIGKMEDGPITMQIKADLPSRSGKQMRYYWGVVIPNIRDHINDLSGKVYDSETVHLMLKNEFLYKEEVIESTGQVIKLTRSLADGGDVAITEMAEFIDNVIMWAWDSLSIAIPEPGQVTVTS